MTRRELGFLIAGGSLYLTVVGFLTGMVVEHVRFDRQRATLCYSISPPRTSGCIPTSWIWSGRPSFPDVEMIAELSGGQ
jgi:hypothetical protein